MTLVQRTEMFKSLLETIRSNKLCLIAEDMKVANSAREAIAFYVEYVFSQNRDPLLAINDLKSTEVVLNMRHLSDYPRTLRFLVLKIVLAYRRILDLAAHHPLISAELRSQLLAGLAEVENSNSSKDIPVLPQIQKELFVPDWYHVLCRAQLIIPQEQK